VGTAVCKNGDVTEAKNSNVSLRLFYDDSTAAVETANLNRETSVRIVLSELAANLLAAAIIHETPTYNGITSVAGR